MTRLPRTPLPCELEGGGRTVLAGGSERMEPSDPGGGEQDDKEEGETSFEI